MSTRSNIGILRSDGTVKGIYCHSDGYIEYNGVMLDCFYRDIKDVEYLIDNFSSVLSLGVITDIKKGSDLDRYSLESKEYAISRLYTRGRLLGNGTHGEMIEQIECPLSMFNYEEYAYVFNPKTSKWKVIGGSYTEWTDLSKAIVESAVYKGRGLTFRGVESCFRVLYGGFDLEKDIADSALNNLKVYKKYLTKLKKFIDFESVDYSYEYFYNKAKSVYEQNKKKNVFVGVLKARIEKVNTEYGTIDLMVDKAGTMEKEESVDMVEFINCIKKSDLSVSNSARAYFDYKSRLHFMLTVSNPSLLKNTPFFVDAKGIKQSLILTKPLNYKINGIRMDGDKEVPLF